MKKGETPAKNKIDKTTFEKLCGVWCTLDEIAGIFDVSEDTIESWCKDTYKMTFSDIYKRKSSVGKVSLRRMQYDSAKKGNVTMQIWLGKQQLGQREQMEVTNEKEINKVSELLEKIEKGAKNE